MSSTAARLRDRTAIVTGASRGIGRAIALRFAGEAARVGLIARDAGALAEVARACTAAGAGAAAIAVADVADPAQVARAAETLRAALGPADVVVNNAGAVLRKPALEITDAEWRRVLAVNLDGPAFMTRAVVAKMLATESKPGVIVNISSISRHGNRGQSNYVASKAALAANTVTWAREFARFGIRVGAIAPGMVETPMTQGMNQRARDALVASIPVGRIGQPEDLWRAVQFVLECDYFNGRTIDVDGGAGMG